MFTHQGDTIIRRSGLKLVNFQELPWRQYPDTRIFLYCEDFPVTCYNRNRF